MSLQLYWRLPRVCRGSVRASDLCRRSYIVMSECLTRVSKKRFKQECLTGVSSKSVLQECQARVSSKSVLQECQVRVSSKSVK